MKFKKIISSILTAAITGTMIFSSVAVFNAAESLECTFAKTDAGYAQGTIKLSAQSGSYDLYWADNTKALDGYQSIASLTFSQYGTQTYTLPAQTAIPENATKMIAVKSAATHTVYFINNIKWNTPYCYSYERSNTSNKNASWPGQKMTYVTNNSDGYGVYSIELNSSFDEMVLNNGSSGNKNQTVDIVLGSNNAYTISDTSSSSKYNVKTSNYGNSSSPSSKLVADAAAVYTIPQSKIATGKKLYSFASYSDIQIDNAASAYPYSSQNWKNALAFAKSQNTNFIVTSGDNVNSSSLTTQQTEWTTYLNAIKDTGYTNPVYEAIGNHELWPGVTRGTPLFISKTGLDGTQSTVDKGKPYFEVTQNGDHFIFMALEGGFYPNQVEEFTNEQLTWAESLIKKYTGDGHNIFIIEHSPFMSYGAGDDLSHPYYDIPLSDNQSSTKALKSMFQKYRDVIFISGHTHIQLSQQYNYSDNNGTSCQMIHNSSVGGSRTIVNNALDYNYTPSRTEGYIVDVYEDRLIFKGANLYSGEFLPNCTYIVKTSASIANPQPATTAPTTAPVEAYSCGDVNGDNTVSIEDVSTLQRYVAGCITFTDVQKKAADTDNDGIISITDASIIQSYLVDTYTSLPVTK